MDVWAFIPRQPGYTNWSLSFIVKMNIKSKQTGGSTSPGLVPELSPWSTVTHRVVGGNIFFTKLAKVTVFFCLQCPIYCKLLSGRPLILLKSPLDKGCNICKTNKTCSMCLSWHDGIRWQFHLSEFLHLGEFANTAT